MSSMRTNKTFNNEEIFSIQIPKNYQNEGDKNFVKEKSKKFLDDVQKNPSIDRQTKKPQKNGYVVKHQSLGGYDRNENSNN